MAPDAGRDPLLEQLLRSLEWTCHTLWLVDRREPELLELHEQRGSTGFPHYILSRAGMLPASEWSDALFVLPGDLVERMRERCLALGPQEYLDLALDAGSRALRRLRPEEPGPELWRLSRSAGGGGGLPQAWVGQPATKDAHRDFLQAAMAVREGRALAHYRAASSRELKPPELLELTARQPGGDRGLPQRLYRWSDDDVAQAEAALRGRGLLAADGEASKRGQALWADLEAETDRWSRELLAPCSAQELQALGQTLRGYSASS